jgi:hypothetical protein
MGCRWALGFGFLAMLFEFAAYISWTKDYLDESEREEVRSIPTSELAKIKDQELIVQVLPNVTKVVSLENIVAASVEEETADFIALVLTDSSGVAERHYIQTSHSNRDTILPMVRDYVQRRATDT